MKDAAVLGILLTTLATSAGAQTASSRVTQPRAATVSPAVRETTTAQVTPYGAAIKQTLPANLFSVEDRAIIIVGGKQVAAGDVKRQLLSELRQTAGPMTSVRTVSRMNTQPVRENPGMGFPRLNVRSPQDRITATGGIAGASVAGPGRETLANNPALSYTEMRNYCKTHPIEISRVRGTVTPNGRFTIEGICFGDQTGEVRVIGQFPGGNMRLLFDSWSDVEIKAFVPQVSGAADHAISLTVIRHPDNVPSAAAQAKFVATRTMVPVPPRYWTPSADFVQIDVDQGGGNIFSGFTVFGSGPADARVAPFSLQINPACALDTAGMDVRTGQVLAITGWEDGPLYQANVSVAWTPRCVIQTSNYIVASSSQRICSVDFTLTAQASCPVGLAP